MTTPFTTDFIHWQRDGNLCIQKVTVMSRWKVSSWGFLQMRAFLPFRLTSGSTTSRVLGMSGAIFIGNKSFKRRTRGRRNVGQMKQQSSNGHASHDDVIKWKHFPRYWSFVRGIHCHRWIPRTKASDAELRCFLWSAPEKRLSDQSWGRCLRRHRAHYDVTVMASQIISRWSGLFDIKPLPEPMLACDLTLWDTLQWNINRNTKIFIQENACEMASIFSGLNTLTHWDRVTHICVSNLAIIGSDNGLSPGRRQAIIWTSYGILLIGPLGRNFSEILIEIQTFSFIIMHLKI